MEILTKIANGFQPPTIFTKSSILDAWQGSEYASLDAISMISAKNSKWSVKHYIMYCCFFYWNSINKNFMREKMKKTVSYGKILNLHMFSHDRKPVFFVALKLGRYGNMPDVF